MVAKYILVFAVGILIGWVIGMFFAAAASAHSDKIAVDTGIIRIGNRFYKVTPLSGYDADEADGKDGSDEYL